jgi:sugar lactone lactonase YvrE
MKTSAFCCIVVCALCSAHSLRGQSGLYEFTTIAGLAGKTGPTDGTNDSARFNAPGDLTVDASGNLFISDILNHAIRRVSAQGTNWVVTTIAGSLGNHGYADGTNTDAQFDHPNGITMDHDGNLFVADHYNHTIRKISPEGTNWIVTTIAGLPLTHGSDDGTNSDARFWSPTGIAVGDNRNVFVVDTANFTVRKLSEEGTNWVVTTIAGFALAYGFVDATNSDAQFDYPYGIAAGGTNQLFVSDWGNHAIREISAIGKEWVVTTMAGSGDIGSSDGAGSFATFNFPNGICTDSAGNVYVSDQSNDTIRKLVPTNGTWISSTIAGKALQAGTSDGLGSDVRFKHPWGVAVNSAGDLFVTDYGNQTIRKGVFRPALRMAMAARQLVLSWPTAATLFTLETSTSPDPRAAWLPVTNAPVTNGLNFLLPIQPTSAPAFYRLQRH